MGLTHKQKMIVVILLAGAVLAVLNQTLLSPAFPTIMADLHVDATTVQSLTSADSLVEAVIIPLSAYLQPPLTTYDQDGDEIGRSAGRLILDAIEKPRGASERVTVTGRLIPRESVADLRAR